MAVGLRVLGLMTCLWTWIMDLSHCQIHLCFCCWRSEALQNPKQSTQIYFMLLWYNKGWNAQYRSQSINMTGGNFATVPPYWFLKSMQCCVSKDRQILKKCCFDMMKDKKKKGFNGQELKQGLMKLYGQMYVCILVLAGLGFSATCWTFLIREDPTTLQISNYCSFWHLLPNMSRQFCLLLDQLRVLLPLGEGR